MKKCVLMLGHRARSGKDTLADLIMHYNSYFSQKLAFADKLKSVVKDLYGLTDEHVYGSLKETPLDQYPGYTPRMILQKFGQDQRAINPNIWADYVFRQIENSDKEINIITDLRFPNEHEVALKWAHKDPDNRHVFAIRIVRPDLPAISGSDDISETALDKYDRWDYTILNNSSKVAMYDTLCEYIRNNKLVDKLG